MSVTTPPRFVPYQESDETAHHAFTIRSKYFPHIGISGYVKTRGGKPLPVFLVPWSYYQPVGTKPPTRMKAKGFYSTTDLIEIMGLMPTAIREAVRIDCLRGLDTPTNYGSFNWMARKMRSKPIKPEKRPTKKQTGELHQLAVGLVRRRAIKG